MELLLNAKQMKDCDEQTIHRTGIPSAVLMERAALAVVDEMQKARLDLSQVLVICGSGNNGGDGFAIARILSERSGSYEMSGCHEMGGSYEMSGSHETGRFHMAASPHVTVGFVGNDASMTEETALQRKICENLGINICSNFTEREYTVIVDAIFGIGLSRPVEGRYAEVIRWVNAQKSVTVSVDIPSGVSADDGGRLGAAVNADLTVTFACRKIGQILYPGAACCGRLICRDIGILVRDPAGTSKPETLKREIPNSEILNSETALAPGVRVFTYTKRDLDAIPPRRPYSNKGSYGKVLLIAGSEGMSGAAYLAAKSAFRSGCGMVRVFTPACNRAILQGSLPEAMVTVWDPQGSEAETAARLQKALSWADVAGVGPGLGTSDHAAFVLKLVLESCEKPLVVDADALNLLAMRPELRNELRKGEEMHPELRNELRRGEELRPESPNGYASGENLRGACARTILTPHVGEMARLTGKEKAVIAGGLLASARNFAAENGVICVLKDARTAVSDGGQVYLNTSGNDGMAVAGSGDVLTGLICGLLAQSMPCFDAAVLGVYLHGLSGDLAKRELGAYGMMAGDIAEHIGRVMDIGRKHAGPGAAMAEDLADGSRELPWQRTWQTGAGSCRNREPGRREPAVCLMDGSDTGRDG